MDLIRIPDAVTGCSHADFFEKEQRKRGVKRKSGSGGRNPKRPEPDFLMGNKEKKAGKEGL